MSCVKQGGPQRKRKACLGWESRGWSQHRGWRCLSNWLGPIRSKNCLKTESQTSEEQRQPRHSWFEASGVQSDQFPKRQFKEGLLLHHMLYYSNWNSVLIASADYLRDRKKKNPISNNPLPGSGVEGFPLPRNKRCYSSWKDEGQAVLQHERKLQWNLHCTSFIFLLLFEWIFPGPDFSSLGMVCSHT